MKTYYVARHERHGGMFRDGEVWEVYFEDSDLPCQLGRNLFTVALFQDRRDAEEYAERKGREERDRECDEAFTECSVCRYADEDCQRYEGNLDGNCLNWERPA